MSLRILIAHSLPGQRGTQSALYIGSSGADLETAKAAAPAHVGSFSIINNPPAIRKTNPLYDPQAKAPPAVPASEPVKFELPADLKGLKKEELAHALVGAIARIQNLEDVNAALVAQTTQQQEQTEAKTTEENQEPKADTPPSVS